MKTATFVCNCDGYTGDARLYRCDPPVAYRSSWDATEDSFSEFIVVSATEVMGTPETYIFPANAGGQVVSWSELDGSFQGDSDHVRALTDAGYAITTTENPK